MCHTVVYGDVEKTGFGAMGHALAILDEDGIFETAKPNVQIPMPQRMGREGLSEGSIGRGPSL